MPKRLKLALHRPLEVVLVVATVATGYAAIRGQVDTTALAAVVLIASSVTLDHLLDRGRNGHCVPRFGKRAP